MGTRETRSAGGIVLNEKGEVLLVSHAVSNLWGFPKGKIDEGEEALEAAKREIFEESGVSNLEYVEELGTYSRFRVSEGGWEELGEVKIITMFLFRVKGNVLPVSQDPENPEARFFPKEEALSLVKIPKDKAFFESVLNKL